MALLLMQLMRLLGMMMSNKPTQAMIEEAKRGLEWRDEFGRGGTEVGVARARDISNGKNLSDDTVKRMFSFFSRHEVDKKAEGFRPGEDGYPSAGRVAWALWGGDPGFAWSRRIVKSMDRSDERQVQGVSDAVFKGLQNKVKDHNEKVGDVKSKRTNVRTLIAVFKRGIGAYKTNPQSVRPSMKGNPEGWAYARVNSYLYALRNGRFKSGKHDQDLLPSGHPMSTKDRAMEEHLERHIENVEEDDEKVVITFAKKMEAPPVEEESMGHIDEEKDHYGDDEDHDMMIKDLSSSQIKIDVKEFDDNKVYHRAEMAKPKSINEEDRTAIMSISSESPVERNYGNEVLVHSMDAIDLKFLQSGTAPLLMDHDQKRQVGVIESVNLDSDARRLRAKVRFGRSALAEEAFTDVKDGIKGNVSIGYSIKKMEREDGDKDTFRAISWRPVEASIVSIPADDSVGIGRSTATANNEPHKGETEMSQEDITRITSEATNAAQRNAAQIIELGSRHGKVDLAQKAINDGLGIEQFREQILDSIASTGAVNSQEIGLSEKEVKRFSLVKAIRALANPTDRKAQEQAAFELEASRAASSEYGVDAQGIMLPRDVLKNWSRDLSVTNDSAIVADDFRAGDFIDVLRNQSSVMRAGATMLTGLTGPVKIPKKATAAAAAFVSSEGAAVSESEMTVGQVTMTMQTLGAFTDVTRNLLIQSSLDVENLIRDDLTQAMALAIDAAGLEGSGSSGNPTGIRNTSGINGKSFAGTNPTFAEVVDMETLVAADNALIGTSLAYILNPAQYGALKTTEKASNTAQFVVEQPGNTVNGYPIFVSNQATAGKVYFGNFSDLLIGMFGGVDITVDPYTASNTGTIRIVALQSVDVAVRHAVSFCLGSA